MSTSMSGDQRQPVLGCGRPPYPNNISAREMDSLTAICDTFLPSLGVPSSSDGTWDDDALVEFYGTSASMSGTHEHLGRLLSGKLQHSSIGLVRVVLWLLSTWWGTFAICGLQSLSKEFPYFQRFSAVAPKQREAIIFAWSVSYFFYFRILFKCMKFTILLMHFSQVDEKNYNSAWKAMDYCGPDPRFVGSDQYSDACQETAEKKEECHGPLHDEFVIDGGAENKEAIRQAFRRRGYSITTTTDATSTFTVHCHAVVVGSGSGGSVVAGELAKAGYKVIVVEKGRYFKRRDLSLLEGPSVDNMYEGGGLVTTNDLGVMLLAGSTVGGGSTINWSASVRTPEHVLNEWCEQHDLKLFGNYAFQHALDAVWHRMDVQDEVTDEGFNNAVLRKGCLELGYPVSFVPRNAPKDHSCGWCHLGCRDGAKQSSQETWLADMVNSGNGVILTSCRASKVLHRPMVGRPRNVARGIMAELENGNGTIIISSSVIVVAGGALNTPSLLRKSGLMNPHIGKNLHLHPVVMAWGHFAETDDDYDIVWPEKEKKSYKGGIITSMSTAVANFNSSGYGAVIQTPVLHPGMFSALMPWVSATDFRRRMTKFSRTAHLFALARDKGSGDASNYPETLSYRLDSQDVESLRRGMESMLRILAAAGAMEIGTQHCEGKVFNVKEESREELEKFVKEASGRGLKDLSTPMCSAHQMGTCRMGAEEAVSAVGPRGETWEVEGLFVADTSVFPTAVGVNPMVTVQAIAYCTAHSILGILNSKKEKQH